MCSCEYVYLCVHAGVCVCVCIYTSMHMHEEARGRQVSSLGTPVTSSETGSLSGLELTYQAGPAGQGAPRITVSVFPLWDCERKPWCPAPLQGLSHCEGDTLPSLSLQPDTALSRALGQVLAQQQPHCQPPTVTPQPRTQTPSC